MAGISVDEARLYLTIGFFIIICIWLIALTFWMFKKSEKEGKKEKSPEPKPASTEEEQDKAPERKEEE